jgi:inorganic pyrophosphatase
MSKQTLLTALPPFGKDTEEIQAVVETPRGQHTKYKYDEELGLFRLHKVLPAGAVFPLDFGFVPSTRCEDGDPLDILIFNDEAALTGCVVKVRLLGVLEAEQTEGNKTVRNDRLLAVATASRQYSDLQSVKAMSKQLQEELEHFFISYNEMDGRQFKPLGWHGKSSAEALIQQGMKRY